MVPIFIPKKSVGEFYLKENIDDYKKHFQFEFTPIDDSGYETYTIFNPEISLFVSNNVIDSIACEEECLFQGKNLIGISLEEFIAFTDENYIGEPDQLDFEEDSDVPQMVYEFGNLGLQVWTKNEIIVTIIASD